jgi:hypothetical protein
LVGKLKLIDGVIVFACGDISQMYTAYDLVSIIIIIIIIISVVFVVVVIVVKEITYCGCVCICCFYLFLETVFSLYAIKIYARMNVAVSTLDCQ